MDQPLWPDVYSTLAFHHKYGRRLRESSDGHLAYGNQSALDSIDLLSRVDLYHLAPTVSESRDRCLDSYDGQGEKRCDNRDFCDIHWTFVLYP